MFQSRRLVFPVLVMLLLATGSSSALAAADPAPIVVNLKDASIPWLYPVDDMCPQLPAGLTINGDDGGSSRVKTAVATTLPDGRRRAKISDQIMGTAHDNLGGAYKFVYVNVATLDFDGSQVNVQMTDQFHLKGDNARVSFGFNWRWAYPAQGLDVFAITDGSGNTVDVGIDPFVFVTLDGVNPDPGIIPGSWEQVFTNGSLYCDPL